MHRILLLVGLLLLLGLPGGAALADADDCCPQVETSQDEDDCCDSDFGFCCTSLGAALPAPASVDPSSCPTSAPGAAPVFEPLPLPRANGPPPLPPPIR